MARKEDIHFTIALLINILLVALMIKLMWSAGEKSVIIPVLLYPALIILNGITWLLMRMDRDPRYKIYQWMTIALIAFIVPFIFIFSMNSVE